MAPRSIWNIGCAERCATKVWLSPGGIEMVCGLSSCEFFDFLGSAHRVANPCPSKKLTVAKKSKRVSKDFNIGEARESTRGIAIGPVNSRCQHQLLCGLLQGGCSSLAEHVISLQRSCYPPCSPLSSKPLPSPAPPPTSTHEITIAKEVSRLHDVPVSANLFPYQKRPFPNQSSILRNAQK